VIVIGGSAGAVESLERIVSRLTATIEAAVLVVVHIPSHARSMLPAILTRSGPLPATHLTEEAEPIRPGHIYVAPPDRHMAISGENVYLMTGPRINRHRPSIDPLFISAARSYGSGAIAVLLSGYLDDGVAGLGAIKEAGGTVIVQDPASTTHQDMPMSALARVSVDYKLGPEEIGETLNRLASAKDVAMSGNGSKRQEAGEVSLESLVTSGSAPEPQPTVELLAMSCPDCGGVLQAVETPDPERFRCRVGHAFSLDSLFAAKTEEIETALWTAVRALEEKAEMSRSLALRLRRRGAESSGTRYTLLADTTQRDANLLKTVLSGRAEVGPSDV
jgi:two-component system, chemotaxis family, protein-glutamate methylesterase/glutaminase